MYSLKDMPSTSSIFSAYASFTASMMLIRSMANELIPHPIRGYVVSYFRYFYKARSNKLTLIIEEHSGMGRNQVYDAAETYLCTKISPKAERLKISKIPKEKSFTIKFEKGEVIADSYEGISLEWRFLSEKNSPNDQPESERRVFELSFDKKHKEIVLHSYLPIVIDKAKQLKDEEKVVKLCTLRLGHTSSWESINLEHPSTFETLAMDSDLKRSIIDDLDMFVRRRDFYKRVGKAWKRGYLLYGPPGTGKSSLIAAMANYLKFDVYDLQLGNLTRDSDLRRLLLMTANRSILVIEDIDCSIDMPNLTGKKNSALLDRRQGNGRKQPDVQDSHKLTQLTLSGLLNFVDGLWSSCGDERIIIFTTNHKDRLDPALLRPGRMDMHIHMSYCTPQGFKILASNYLGISGYHKFFGEIEGLLENAAITPAQVAEELMKSENAEVALTGLANVLKRKVTEGDQEENEARNKGGVVQAKRQKIGNAKKRAVKNIRRSNRKKNM